MDHLNHHRHYLLHRHHHDRWVHVHVRVRCMALHVHVRVRCIAQPPTYLHTHLPTYLPTYRPTYLASSCSQVKHENAQHSPPPPKDNDQNYDILGSL